MDSQIYNQQENFTVLFVVFFCPNASCDLKEEGEEERKKNEEAKDERTEEKEVKGKKRGLFKTMGEAKALSKYSYTLFIYVSFLLYLSETKQAVPRRYPKLTKIPLHFIYPAIAAIHSPYIFA